MAKLQSPQIRHSSSQRERGAVRVSTSELRRAIEREAYRLYEERGRRSGHDLEDWLQAERMVRRRFGPQA